MPLRREDETEAVIGAAIAVHRTLGPGFTETIYEKALEVELGHRSIPFRTQVFVPIRYRGVKVGVHRLDLLAFADLVVELKAVNEIQASFFVIVRSYLKALGTEDALILNFGRPTLDVRRVTTRRSDPGRIPGSVPGFLGSSENSPRAPPTGGSLPGGNRE